MAQWDGQSLLGLSRGFMKTRVFLTGAELGLYTLLNDNPLSAEEIAEQLGAAPRPLTIVLDALAAMELLVKEEGRYRIEPSSSALLAEDAPGSVLPMVRHAANLWKRWSALTELVGARAVEEDPDASLRAFIGAMHIAASPQAASIVELVKPGNARRLLDVGGASGTYTIAFLRAVPGMTATLFDRPPVVEMARERLAEAGLLDRVALAAGDFNIDPLPGGHDLVFLSAIIHMNSPAQNVALYRKVYDALLPGGRIVVRDHIMSPDRISPKVGAIFAINMLTATDGGNSYTYDEIRDTLAQAGFTRIALTHPDERMDGIVQGFKE
jgi:predicted O-methyltransferase YrrM